MWSNIIEYGGWGMYPTSIFGFFLVAAGVVLALRPERRFVNLVIALAVGTFGSGVLSTCVGVANSFHYLRQVPVDRQLGIAAAGCAESLHNMVLALILVVITSLLATIAALRAGRPSEPTGAAG